METFESRLWSGALAFGGISLSHFLEMPPRPLPIALAEYLAATGDDEDKRRAIAGRILSTLTAEQRAETARRCDTLRSDAPKRCLRLPRRDG
jgi:hypothetical protein